MSHRSIPLLLLAAVLVVSSPAWADTVSSEGRDDDRGDVKRGTGGYMVTDESGKSQFVALDQVKSIELGLGAAAATSPDRAGQTSIRSAGRSNTSTTSTTSFAAMSGSSSSPPARPLKRTQGRIWRCGRSVATKVW